MNFPGTDLEPGFPGRRGGEGTGVTGNPPRTLKSARGWFYSGHRQREFVSTLGEVGPERRDL